MPRAARIAPGGIVFHVLNRGVGRMALFRKEADYVAFEAVVERCLALSPGVRLMSYCVMPNHWHLVLRPTEDGELGAFMQRLTLTHTRRWQEHRHCHGGGHVYQGRYKSFPVQTDGHFLTLCRYVERNAARAGLVERAETWRWSSLWRRRSGSAEQRAMLADWPVERPRQWLRTVNAAISEPELEALRRCVSRGRPYGKDAWVERTAQTLGLTNTMRNRGRPRNET
ncbi:MAG: hypothetical protein GVY24_03215 [Planctomycetes bacterium]|jgi:putative transposase|nr:hypothetical protein [Planctomycetota bacterium]